MQFCLVRAIKSAVAISALSFSFSSFSYLAVSAHPAMAQDAAAGAKNWKDRGEYDLYMSITQATDPAKRLELLNQWQDKYPQTDYMKERLQLFVPTTAQAGQPAKTLEYAAKMLKIDPKDATSLFYTAFYGPVVYGAKATPDQLAQVHDAGQGILDNADTVFADKNKPPATSQADWTKQKNVVIGTADAALGWEASVKKDFPTSEKDYAASIQANPENAQVAYTDAGILLADKKYQDALFYYARAAAYDGPGALPPASRDQVKAYFMKIYGQFTGGPDGADKVLALAKTNPTPPADWKLVSAADKANADAGEIQKKLDADPALKQWYAVQQQLITQGASYFDQNVKDNQLPGGDVKLFKGTVISMDPADKPTKLVVGVFDPTKPDATLTFDSPLTSAVKVGDVVEFSGVADTFTKDPFMITFKDVEGPNLKTTAPQKPRAPHKKKS